MKESEIVEYIASIEDKYPVNEWKLYERHIWPFIKMTLCNSLKDIGEVTKKNGTDSHNGHSELSHLKNALMHSEAFDRRLVDVLIFHHNNARNLILDDGTEFDTNLDPFTLLLEKEYSIESLEYLSGSGHLYTFRPSHIVDGGLERAFIESKFLTKTGVCKNAIKEELPCYDEFLDELDACVRAKLGKGSLYEKILYINLLSSYFTRIIKKKHIRFVIAGCGYGTDTAALFMACYDLGVKCMEVQHGIAGGSGHRWYSSWKHMPKDGRRYEMLPDIYWCWGDADKDAIDSWGKRNHIAFLGHKPIHLVMNEIEKLTKGKSFFIDNNKPNILFSLQPEVNYPDWIVKTIEDTFREYNWIIRRHPRNDDCQERLINKVRSIPGVYVDGMDAIMLEKILMHSDAHVTSHSAVALDALEFGVNTVIIGIEYEDVFRNEIDNEYVFLGLDSSSTIKILHMIVENNISRKKITRANGEAMRFLREQIGNEIPV